MATSGGSSQLAAQVRRMYVENLVRNLAALVGAAIQGSRSLIDKPVEHAVFLRRRDLLQELQKGAQAWHRGMVNGLRHALIHGVSASRPGDLPPPGRGGGIGGLTLVDDGTIELEIVTSRLALAIMDRASWEFADLRSRVATLEGRAELDAHDLLRAHVLARIVFDAWLAAGISLVSWRELQPVLHEEFAHLAEEAYHETNRWLVDNRVMPEVDLRPFIRRARTNPQAPLGWGTGSGNAPPNSMYEGSNPLGLDPTISGGFVRTGHGGVGDETRMMTGSAPLSRGGEHAEAVLSRLNRLVGRHLPKFGRPAASASVRMSPGLAQAIDGVQTSVRRHFAVTTQRAMQVTAPAMLEDMHQRKQALKKAAATPEERATIEIVALLFQSILTEDRIPAAVRVWFARLQMPVLRVAVSEPDFFATTDHPARRLIDRMGACVMGFDNSAQVGEALEKEIKRIVQVVEAYPDTGRRVFKTVLTEFEKFLEGYFREHNEATKKGVSLAQQVEQRETLAIQYTIELRRMLNEMPVQEGVRQFLFHTWADVLATTAVRYGPQGEPTRKMKRAAADLIWSASAKVSREERAEVIRRLPPLLKQLREGMAAAGMDAGRQEEQLQQLNNSLAAAFTARAAVIPDERLREMMERLETLEELLPDASNVEIDESMVLDLSGHQSSELEIVLTGGSMPVPAMVAWARELQVGTWYMLEHKGRTEPVQLVWHGLRKQLSLFVTPQGHCMLFQQHRLASYLQAGLLVPAQDEALTVRATRNALAKLDVDSSQLLN
jgi:hypothetical protein